MRRKPSSLALSSSESHLSDDSRKEMIAISTNICQELQQQEFKSTGVLISFSYLWEGTVKAVAFLLHSGHITLPLK